MQVTTERTTKRLTLTQVIGKTNEGKHFRLYDEKGQSSIILISESFKLSDNGLNVEQGETCIFWYDDQSVNSAEYMLQHYGAYEVEIIEVKEVKLLF